MKLIEVLGVVAFVLFMILFFDIAVSLFTILGGLASQKGVSIPIDFRGGIRLVLIALIITISLAIFIVAIPHIIVSEEEGAYA
jgi:hypothetical protein